VPPGIDIQLRLGHAHRSEIRWYRHPYPDPGDGQATRDAIDAALAEAGSRPRAGSSLLTLLTEKLTSLRRATYTFSLVTAHARVG
jgi:hypothetical protein